MLNINSEQRLDQVRRQEALRRASKNRSVKPTVRKSRPVWERTTEVMHAI